MSCVKDIGDIKVVKKAVKETVKKTVWLLLAMMFVGVACERKPRSCGDGQTLEDGKCVDAAPVVEESEKDTSLSTPIQDLQGSDPGKSDDDAPGQATVAPGGDTTTATVVDDSTVADVKTDLTDSLKSPGKGEPEANIVAECSDQPVAQGESFRRSYLKCRFDNKTVTECRSLNNCSVLLTTEQCKKELARLKSENPGKTTNWSCE